MIDTALQWISICKLDIAASFLEFYWNLQFGTTFCMGAQDQKN